MNTSKTRILWIKTEAGIQKATPYKRYRACKGILRVVPYTHIQISLGFDIFPLLGYFYDLSCEVSFQVSSFVDNKSLFEG